MDVKQRLAEALENADNVGISEGRQRASVAIRSTVERLRRDADQLESLANIAEEAIEQGSPAEEALWRLAISASR